MQANTTHQPEFSIGQARGIVKDLFVPRPAIYWADFLLSMTVGLVAFSAIRRGHLTNFICDGLGIESLAFRWTLISAFFVVSVICFYRAALFTHELVHLRDGAVKGFRVVWNLLCGIPFLMPSFVYHTHVDHHIRKHYGTDQDGEYLPLATGRPWQILWFLSQSFIIPLLAVVRFMVLTPLTWISPTVRDLVHRKASSMIIDPSYVRPLPTRRQRRSWRLQEIGVFAYGLTIATLLTLGRMPLMWLVHAYLTGVAIIMVNAIRTLGAHRYRCTGGDVSFLDQLLDSLNYPRWPWLANSGRPSDCDSTRCTTCFHRCPTTRWPKPTAA